MEPAAFALASWLFVRGVGAVGVVAFASLLVQLPGLYGSRGILPIRDHLGELLRAGAPRWRFPSVFWMDARDTTLRAVATVGLAAALLVTVDLLVVPALIVVWATYLSFATLGQHFLAFQWDALLLEVSVLALVVALSIPPPLPVLGLLWFFVFRFTFSSGMVKLRSGDPTWRRLTAVAYHYETQPLPTRLAWFAHQLPSAIQRGSTLAVLVIEIGVPFLIAGPEPVRLAAVILLALLQLAILLTGNYGFFNLLSLVLFIPLVPDRAWRALFGDLLLPTPAHPPGVVTAVAVVAAGALLACNLLRLVSLFSRRRLLGRLLGVLSCLRLANYYGLFAVMTTGRPEIVIEGSEDGTSWLPYRLRWKPQDPDRAPRWNAPHQPRLDWQLWFAALGSAWSTPWFVQLLQRLLEGSPPVLRLFAAVPFRDRPPRYVRASLYRYTFTDRATRRRTGRWWDVEPVGLYHPAVRLPERTRPVAG